MSNMRTENWCGYEIRFVEIDGEWHAILKDICDALGLRTAKEVMRMTEPEIQEEIDHILDSLFWDEETKTLKRVLIDTSDVPSEDSDTSARRERTKLVGCWS